MADNRCPLASLVVVFYKQEQFVKETIAGALAQTYSNLEIILSDDNSPDGTFEEIQNAVKDYNGPHKIIVNRNDKNMGLVPHINKALFELSHGDFIFINGGDDVSMPKRVEDGVNAFIIHPEVAAVTFSRTIINERSEVIGQRIVKKGRIDYLDGKEYLASPFFMAGAAALSIKRDVLNFFGPLSCDCQTEDSTLRFRALLIGGILSVEEIGLKYRAHSNNMSRTIFKLKTELIAQQYLRDLNQKRASLSQELYTLLDNKITFYIRYGKQQESISHQKGLVRVIHQIYLHIVYFNYKRKVLRLINQI